MNVSSPLLSPDNHAKLFFPRLNLAYEASYYFGSRKYLILAKKWNQILLDRVSDRIDELLKPSTDGIKDHTIVKYIANLIKLLPHAFHFVRLNLTIDTALQAKKSDSSVMSAPPGLLPE